MRIAFIATGDIAIPTFRHLSLTESKPILLITQPDKPVGRHQALTPPEIKSIALGFQIPVWQPEKIGQIAAELTALAPDFIVVMAYGQIIGKSVRQAATKAIINLHASILPKYRGASCIQSAIDSGDSETGITVMRVIRELDAGDIITVKKIPIQPRETAGELHDRLAEIGPAALSEALEILSRNPDHGISQDPARITYSPKLLRDHGRLDFTQAAESLERRIRAYHPWPESFTEITIKGKSKRLKIFPPTAVVDQCIPPGELLSRDGQLLIGCGEKSLLLTQVQPEGSRQMPAADFINSLPAVG
ncbi:MAG: methionyl-tRNA formyltransferase [Armatimonadetes bacterium]|nr:methionyl-tRNA formyltransferase [Akkermansiaceae bacterium]